MKTAVIGSSGQLGTDIYRIYRGRGDEVYGLDHEMLEVASFESCRNRLAELRPDLVINCTAFHQLEKCEKDPERAFVVNSLGARNLALLSGELNFSVVYFSSDYVFDGRKQSPYLETDCPHPLNVYGNTKLSGELFTQTLAPRHFICRTSGLYGSSPCRGKGGLNFVQLMLKLAAERGEVRVVDDEIVSPTYTCNLAEQLYTLTSTRHYGLYHMTSQGACSWYEFAGEIFRLAGVSVRLSIAAPDEFPAKVPRPKYSVLQNSGLQSLNLDRMPSWQDGLRRYLQETGS